MYLCLYEVEKTTPRDNENDADEDISRIQGNISGKNVFLSIVIKYKSCGQHYFKKKSLTGIIPEIVNLMQSVPSPQR